MNVQSDLGVILAKSAADFGQDRGRSGNDVLTRFGSSDQRSSLSLEDLKSEFYLEHRETSWGEPR
jgi:hypothetical protein